MHKACSKQADANRGAAYSIYEACEALAVSFEGALDKIIVSSYARGVTRFLNNHPI